jgi:phage-related protein
VTATLNIFHQGHVRTVAYLVLSDGECQVGEELERMKQSSKGRSPAAAIEAKLRHLADNRHLTCQKQWEEDIYQFRSGGIYRVCTWCGYVCGIHALVVLRVFSKRGRFTPAHDEGEVRRARRELEDLIRRSA